VILLVINFEVKFSTLLSRLMAKITIMHLMYVFSILLLVVF